MSAKLRRHVRRIRALRRKRRTASAACKRYLRLAKRRELTWPEVLAWWSAQSQLIDIVLDESSERIALADAMDRAVRRPYVGGLGEAERCRHNMQLRGLTEGLAAQLEANGNG